MLVGCMHVITSPHQIHLSLPVLYTKHNQLLIHHQNINCDISHFACSVEVASDHVFCCVRSLLLHFEQICLCLAVGAMIDIQQSMKVTKEFGQKFARKNKFDLFFETSAKTGENVQTVSS